MDGIRMNQETVLIPQKNRDLRIRDRGGLVRQTAISRAYGVSLDCQGLAGLSALGEFNGIVLIG